jgi:anti-sigma factor RsiW
MSGCKTINFLFDLLPLKIWRGFLIRRHVESCPACQDRLAAREEGKALLVQAEDVEALSGLWPEVRLKLSQVCGQKQTRKPMARFARRWAIGAAGLLIAVLTSVWLYRGYEPERIQQGDEVGRRFQIQYLRVEDKPALSFVFQPQNSNIIIIWAEKIYNGG